MKKITVIIALIFVACFNVNAQFVSTEESKNFNTMYNDYVYLYKNANLFIQNNVVTEMTIYSNTEILKTIKFGESSKDKKIKSFVLFTTDSTDKKVTRVKLKNSNNQTKIIDVANNDIETINDSRVEKYCKEHVQYMFDNNIVSHNQGKTTMEDRVNKFGIDWTGTFGENCSKDNNWHIYKTDVKRTTSIIKSYFVYRFETEHWKSIVDVENKKYETYYLQKDYIIYSITVMMTGTLR